MTFSSFLLRLILLSLPGIICWKLYRKVRGRRPRQQFEDILDIALFAVLSYAVAVVFKSIFFAPSSIVADIRHNAQVVIDLFLSEKEPASNAMILYASIVAIPLAYIASVMHTYALINRLGRKLKMTHHYGEEDVWQQFLDGPSQKEWVYVRDHKNDLLYFGWIEGYSDSDKCRELLLRDVSVYSNTDPSRKLLQQSRFLYLSSTDGTVTIEMPDFGAEPLAETHPTNPETNDVKPPPEAPID